ncbi:TRAP transporter large permease [Hominifimenecus sp. rT4P-3]|uniref:TRAP transporter large permease n=1 Tax=Hominifimenecus sp. rT4P-3 TaxID=3242979 RepID=UPI003DA337F3
MSLMVFFIFFLLLALSVPIAVSLGFATILPGLLDSAFKGNLAFVYRSIFAGLNTTTVIAIPLFMLSGAIMAKGGLSEKLFDIFAVFIGKIKGGMPCAVVVTCLFYGAISGSGTATCAAVGAMCIPVLTSLGYDKVFAAALVATSAGLGVIIPPSVPFISFALVTDISVGDLFLAGVLPGFLIAFCIILYVQFYCRTKGEDREKIEEKYRSLKGRGTLRVVLDGFWALLAPVIILGGIYSGIVTPTEAACVSVFYSILVCLFIYRTISFRQLYGLFKQALNSYAPLGLMMGLAMAFAKIMVLLQAPQQLTTFLSAIVSNKYIFLLILNLILIVIGMVMDAGPAVMILAPMLLNITKALGIDTVHLGVIMVTNLAIGFVTPPFGMNLFISAPMIQTDPMQVGRKSLPFIGAFLIALLAITYLPAVSLCLL